tara:strand:+ start:1323 stop:1724 length:402 start_codon:yes stop_codon:yes gene_type:complete
MQKGKDWFPAECPCCGYNWSVPKDINARIMRMVTMYTPETTKVIKKVMRDIYNNVPSDKTNLAYYYFLYGIQNIEEQHIRHGIRVFNKGNHYKEGKGFRFLGAIIRNRKANFNKQLDNERQLHGKPPKKRILK